MEECDSAPLPHASPRTISINVSHLSHLLASRQEHDGFDLEVCLDEAPHHVHLLMQPDHRKGLVQLERRRVYRLGVYREVLGVGEAQAGEVADRLGLRVWEGVVRCGVG